MSCDAAQQMSTRIVDFANHPVSVALLRRRRTLRQFASWPECGFLHAERREYVLLSELIQRHSGEVLDQFAEHDVIDIAVSKPRAGLCDRSQLIDSLQRLGLAVAIV